ncbi:phospholipase D-like domain-containing protein [Leptolyngbya sp. FACHB-36]|uniref:phospholipase D-like domain-containing protein n=1 Tax=Leptolyngbya sp. FACHB-36 TaxID=2692808 RepID=UPI00321F9B9F
MHHRLLLGLLALGLTGCQTAQSQSTRPTPLPQEDRIQVYTNHEPASTYTEPYRNQARSGDDLEQTMVDAIATAQSTVDVAVQELRLPKIANALVERQKAGVRVRVILENTYSRPFSTYSTAETAALPERERGRYDEARRLIDRDENGQLSQEEINQGDALVMLDQARVPRLDDTADGSAGSNLMHHKFVVVDNKHLIVTSSNFTTSDVHGDFKAVSSLGNANNLLKIDSPELAALFTQEFNVMWGDGPGKKPDSRFGTKKPFRPAQQVRVGSTLVELQFSPAAKAVPWSRSSNGLIGRTLSTATTSIELALFVFSEQPLVNLLEPLPGKGVKIRGLIDPGFAYRSYSEALDMLGVSLKERCQPESNNRPWSSPITTIGVPRLPPGDLLHHKFGVVDGKIVITGSHNWTAAANTGNDETVLVVHSPIVAAHYQREFDRLYDSAILGIPPALQKKIDAQPSECSLPRSDRSVLPEAAIPAASSAQSQVNLNTATLEELTALPGVGPGLAQRIMAARQRQRFTSLADLDQVPGVGAKLLARLSSRVTW